MKNNIFTMFISLMYLMIYCGRIFAIPIGEVSRIDDPPIVYYLVCYSGYFIAFILFLYTIAKYLKIKRKTDNKEEKDKYHFVLPYIIICILFAGSSWLVCVIRDIGRPVLLD